MFYRGKTVLVTGGTGFVGMHIVQELLKQDARVRLPIHQRSLLIKDSRIETVPADLMQQADCRRLARGVNYVFHAAGVVAAAGVQGSSLMSAISTNLIFTVNMLQAAWQEDVERLLVFSSSTAYPASAHPIKEEELWSGPTHPAYFGYGWMRRYLEKISEFVASKSKIRVALVRPTAVYGRWDNFDLLSAHVIPALIRKAVERHNPYEVWGDGEEVRDFLHVSDLARGCLLMLEKYAQADPVNIGYGRGVTIKEIVQIILNAARYEQADVIFNSSRPSTIPFRMVDTSKATRLLGFTPAVSLEQGLRDTVHWYVQTKDRQIKEALELKSL